MYWSWWSTGAGQYNYLTVCQQLCSLAAQNSQTDYYEALLMLYLIFVKVWFFPQILEISPKEKQ